MSFPRTAALGVALSAAYVFAGCGGDDGGTATLSQSEAESAQAAAKSIQNMGPPPAVGGKNSAKKKMMGPPPVAGGHR